MVKYTVEQLIAAVKEANDCLETHEGVSLLYYMDFEDCTPHKEIIAAILQEPVNRG